MAYVGSHVLGALPFTREFEAEDISMEQIRETWKPQSSEPAEEHFFWPLTGKDFDTTSEPIIKIAEMKSLKASFHKSRSKPFTHLKAPHKQISWRLSNDIKCQFGPLFAQRPAYRILENFPKSILDTPITDTYHWTTTNQFAPGFVQYLANLHHWQNGR